jgi:Cytochrome P460
MRSNRSTKITRTIVLVTLALVSIVSADLFRAAAAENDTVPFPEGYRHWTFLHSSLIGPTLAGFWKRPCEKPCTAGIFHFYANDKAMIGLRTGEYADGAVIAEEMLELLGSPTGGGKEGERRMIGVMVKDSKRYPSTGGWGYGSFDGATLENELDATSRQACFACHIPRKDHGYVFSTYRER